MAIFSGKIVECYYISEDYSNIEIVFDGGDGKYYKHILEADPNSPDFKDLQADGWDDQKILEGTAEYKRSHASAFNKAVQMRASELAREMIGIKRLQDEKNALKSQRDAVKQDIERHHNWLEEKRTQLKKADNSLDEKTEALAHAKDVIKRTTFSIDNALLEVLMSQNEIGDELFKFKLWALEQEYVKSAPKEIKSNIRRVKRITEGIAIIDKLIAELPKEE